VSSGRRTTVRRGRAPNGTGRRWIRWRWVGREGRTHSIPRDVRGTFTPTYGVKVPLMGAEDGPERGQVMTPVRREIATMPARSPVPSLRAMRAR
jgi:hypothetical protein